jgi:predicted nicotinamide N-methyase
MPTEQPERTRHVHICCASPKAEILTAIEMKTRQAKTAQMRSPTIELQFYAMIRVRQSGTRHLGCDESSGWIWRSARVLHETLMREDMNGKSVLELGSGTGWLAIQLALGGAHVTATDRRGALPLLLQNAYKQESHVVDNIEVLELDWCDEMRLPGNWDMIVGSDLIYLHENHIPLLKTIVRHDGNCFILVYEERNPSEELNFLRLAKQFGFSVNVQSEASNPETLNTIHVVTLTTT